MTNNVSQKVHNLKDIAKEGTGVRSVVLLICTLFLIIQFVYVTRTPLVIDELQTDLNVIGEQELSIIRVNAPYKTFAPDSLFSFNSPEYSHLAPFFFKPIPINYCNKSLLMSVKGIGPSLAERILETRISKGKFESPNDLLAIKGIGQARLEKFAPYLSFSKDYDQK